MRKEKIMKAKKKISTLLTVTLIVSIFGVMAPVPTATAWVDGRERAPWTREARNYWANYIHWFVTNYRGAPFLTYIIWNNTGEVADEIAYNASRAVTVDDVRMGLYNTYVVYRGFVPQDFWSDLADFEANAALYGAPSDWLVNGSQSVPPTHTYVEVNQTVFYTDANLTGTRFNVSIWVKNVTDMQGLEIKLGYNASQLRAICVYPGAIPTALGINTEYPGVPFDPCADPVINNTRRYTPDWSPLDSTTYAYVHYGIVHTLLTGFTGTGEYMIIEFEIIDAPPRIIVSFRQNSSIYTYLDLFDTVAGNTTGGDIPHGALDGRYTYIRAQACFCAPVAVSSVYPSTVYVGDTVTFDGTASDPGCNPPLTYYWDVDSDGDIDTYGATVVWPNPTAGTFNVTLTVENAIGLKDTAAPQTWTVYACQPVGGKATPIITPMDSFELLTSYIGLTILLAVVVITVVYVKKRRRNAETNS
jgi:hypothetical protein